MSSCFGDRLKLSLFGESHGAAIGITIDGFPAGVTVDETALQQELSRRAPGRHRWSTARKEADQPEFLSGLYRGKTTGQPITALFRNNDTDAAAYGEQFDLLRPGHADYSSYVRSGGFADLRGGGHASGRLTAPIVLAGALCKQLLSQHSIRIEAHIASMAGIRDACWADEPELSGADLSDLPLPLLRPELGPPMEEAMLAAKRDGDSVGGEIECRVLGLPAGLGAPFFDSVESVLSHLLFSVPAVKAVSFGSGFAFAAMRGSEANDAFRLQSGRIVTATNRCGGVLGGITTGMPVLFRCCIRPTPSIAKEQATVSLASMQETNIAVRGRHDPCIVPRAIPVIEAMAAIGITELWLEAGMPAAKA